VGEPFDPSIEIDEGVDEEISFSDSTAVVEPFSAGSFFGDRFRIDSPLGTGGMGAVFKATDLKANRQIALKVLLKARRDGESRQRFAREAEILSKLSHPGIVGIHGFGHAQGGVPWLAMELVEGESLGDRVRRKGPLPADEVAPILRAVCDALQTAHAAGVIHRDLKPDNIILRKHAIPAQAVKLIDFGLSRVDDAKRLTATGTMIGTPRYMAPEQISSIKNSGPRSDIYALGVMVFESLTGESPFQASDHGQLLGAILQGRIQKLSQIRPDLPPETEAVVARAMDKDPDVRFQTPLEFAQAFSEATGTRTSHLKFTGEEKLTVPAKTYDWKFYAVLVGLGLLGAVGTGLVTYLLLR
jgi:serine/threonine protein kinase